jgi:hypothetical protein
MMTLLAKGLGWLFGSKLLPMGLAGALLLTGHQLWLARDRRIEVAATAKCEATQELALAKAQLAAVRRQAHDAHDTIIQERKLNEDLRHERQSIAAEFAAHKAAASADPRCLSDSVLKLLGGADGLPKAR